MEPESNLEDNISPGVMGLILAILAKRQELDTITAAQPNKPSLSCEDVDIITDNIVISSLYGTLWCRCCHHNIINLGDLLDSSCVLAKAFRN